MSAGMTALKMIHAVEPKQEILDEIGALIGDVEPLGAQVLVAAYVRPEKTAGGIILADNTRGEDNYQGKVGLVLKLGPLAFADDAQHQWGARKPVVGDWVIFRVGDTFPTILGKRQCRFVEDVSVKAILARPDSVL